MSTAGSKVARRALAPLVLVPLVVAGCSNGNPKGEPTPRMSKPTSSSSTPTESESPEVESAEDFIRRWVEEDRKMFETGETGAFLGLGPNCADCRKIAQAADRIYEAGGTVRWDGWTVRTIENIGSSSDHAFRFVVDSAPTRYREAGAAPWMTLAGGRVIQFIKLEPYGSTWLVLESRELSE